MKKQLILFSFLLLNSSFGFSQNQDYLTAGIIKDSILEKSDPIKKIFGEDIIYITDFDETNQTYEGFINGEKIKVKSNNILIADSTKIKLKSWPEENKEPLINYAKSISKKYYQIELEKAKRYYQQAEKDDEILVNFIDDNFFAKTQTFKFQYVNPSNKLIKSLVLVIECYADENRTEKLETKSFKIKAQDKSGRACHILKIAWKTKPKLQLISSIKIQFENGATKEINDVNYLPELWLNMLTQDGFKKCK